MDLQAEARRLAEETARKMRNEYGPDHRPVTILSALLAFGRLVREEDAKVCEDEATKADASMYIDAGAVHRTDAKLIRAKSLE